jgi:hypothetical protein
MVYRLVPKYRFVSDAGSSESPESDNVVLKALKDNLLSIGLLVLSIVFMVVLYVLAIKDDNNSLKWLVSDKNGVMYDDNGKKKLNKERFFLMVGLPLCVLLPLLPLVVKQLSK